MKKGIFIGLAAIAVAAAAAFTINYNQNKSELSMLSFANVEALATEFYIHGQSGTNWKTYSLTCVALEGVTGTNVTWTYDQKVGAYYMGIGASSGGGTGGSSGTGTTYAPMTFIKHVCGYGAGLCMDSAPSGHPCA